MPSSASSSGVRRHSRAQIEASKEEQITASLSGSLVCVYREGDVGSSHLWRQATVHFRNGEFTLIPPISSQLHNDLLCIFLLLSCSV